MRYYKQDITVEQKADASPVTIADKEAEKLIQKIIQAYFPEYGFLGEESGGTHADKEKLWVIDPIDGTKNFIRHIPIFGILIGLMQYGKCTLGVSNVPGMNELMYGQKGLGAFLNGQSAHVSNIASLEKGSVSCGGLKHFRTSGRFAGLEKLITRSTVCASSVTPTRTTWWPADAWKQWWKRKLKSGTLPRPSPLSKPPVENVRTLTATQSRRIPQQL